MVQRVVRLRLWGILRSRWTIGAATGIMTAVALDFSGVNTDGNRVD
jgi:hypothetical protein